MKKLNFILITLLIIVIIVVLRIPKKERKYPILEREAPLPQPAQEEKVLPYSPPIISKESSEPKEKVEMKVNFYAINREKAEKGEFLGSAELKGGELIIDVSDPKLKEILEKPYSTMAGEVEEGVATEWLVAHQPGTVEHLRAIAIECWQFGYIGEIEE